MSFANAKHLVSEAERPNKVPLPRSGAKSKIVQRTFYRAQPTIVGMGRDLGRG